jgi:hypothetical protein
MRRGRLASIRSCQHDERRHHGEAGSWCTVAPHSLAYITRKKAEQHWLIGRPRALVKQKRRKAGGPG